MEINKQAYNAYVKEVTPTNPVWKNILRAFVTGGAICTIGQVFLNWLQSYGVEEPFGVDSGQHCVNWVKCVSEDCEVGRGRSTGADYWVCQFGGGAGD